MAALADNSDLAKIHEEAMTAANASWTETDKLYVSVCSALIALATLFGHSASNPGLAVSLLGALVFLLSINWAWLIRRYRKKILSALKGLAQEHGDSRISQYYQAQRRRFKHDRSDYLIVGVVVFASVILILYPIWKKDAQPTVDPCQELSSLSK
jgi:hypothetical protein